MNEIQKQLSEVFKLPEKYKMSNYEHNILKNTVQLLVNSLSIITKLGLEDELIKM